MSAEARGDVGGGPNRGLSYALSQIDPDTLPEEDAWEEVKRRVQAFREDRAGWRTGSIASELDEYAGES